MTDPSRMFRLDGKVALITGSTKGLGLATAKVLAGAGAHVVISSRKPDECQSVVKALKEVGLSAEAHPCHIGKLEEIDTMEAHLGDVHGGLDILVNNAVLSPLRSIEDTDPGLFRKTVEVDLQGYWYMSVAATRLMKMKNGGSIINVASVAALHPDKGLALYSTLKTALIGMSRSFALEYGEDGIRVNTILPGLFETQLAEKYSDEDRGKMYRTMCLPRLGRPEEIGYAALYLTSPASAFVTGASLVVDGGLSVALM